MLPADAEKRQEKRFNLSTALRYQIRGSVEFGSTLTKNISRGGLSFITDRFIKPQTKVALDFNILSRNINSIATVRWSGVLSHSDRYQIGTEFTDLNPQDRKYISDYLDIYLTFKE